MGDRKDCIEQTFFVDTYILYYAAKKETGRVSDIEHSLEDKFC